MRAIVDSWYTDIYPTDEEVKNLCRPGQGADTCIWLVMGSDGWECTMLHKPHSLLERWLKGKTVAKRDGCQKVSDFNPVGMIGEVEF